MVYDKKSIDQVANYCLRQGQTIAVAESVTAGHLQAALSLADNASGFFQGGITAYNIGQKVRHLSVEPVKALLCNCVSEPVSITMAQEVCKFFLSDYGVGITGYASPVPEAGIEKLFALIAVAHNGRIIALERLEAIDGDSYNVQVNYANRTLQIISSLFNSMAPDPHVM